MDTRRLVHDVCMVYAACCVLHVARYFVLVSVSQKYEGRSSSALPAVCTPHVSPSAGCGLIIAIFSERLSRPETRAVRENDRCVVRYTAHR